METAGAVGDGTLSNEHLGRIFRRVTEIITRIQAGSLSVKFVLEELQRIIEGKPQPPPPPPKIPEFILRPRYWEPPLREFVRPSVKERKKSRSPYGRRLPESNQRLLYPERTPEHVMAEMWEAENIPASSWNYGRCAVQGILDMNSTCAFKDLSKRDIEVVASTLQWLGTNVGKEFLSRFIRTAQILI